MIFKEIGEYIINNSPPLQTIIKYKWSVHYLKIILVHLLNQKNAHVV